MPVPGLYVPRGSAGAKRSPTVPKWPIGLPSGKLT